MTSDTVRRLSKLDTPILSDALDELHLNGIANGLSQLSSKRRIAGRAVTVLLELAGKKGPRRYLGSAAVESSGPDDVIVVQHRSRDDCAGWGGMLSLAASINGVQGAIVDGSVRAVDRCRELDFPLYARAVTPVASRGRVMEQAYNTRISVGRLTVNPGDFVLADSSGVVFVPAHEIDEGLAVAERVAQRDAGIRQALQEGAPVSRVMDQHFGQWAADAGDG